MGGLDYSLDEDGTAIGGPALSLVTPLRQSRARRHDEQNRWAIRVRSRIMADRLNGYRILILETREEAQFSRLLAEQGADVLQCPMFTIHDAPDPAPVEAWIRRFIEAPFDDLVLMTGEGLRRLMKVARRMDVEREFVAAVGSARKFARGPKPGRALREIGLEPQVTTEKPTSEGIAEMLARVDLAKPSRRLAALSRQGSQRADRRHHGAGRRGRYRVTLCLRCESRRRQHRHRDRRDGARPRRRHCADQLRARSAA